QVEGRRFFEVLFAHRENDVSYPRRPRAPLRVERLVHARSIGDRAARLPSGRDAAKSDRESRFVARVQRAVGAGLDITIAAELRADLFERVSAVDAPDDLA